MLKFTSLILALLFTGCAVIPLTCGALTGQNTNSRNTGSQYHTRNADDGWIINNFPAALAESKRTGKPVLVDFTGYMCTNCRWMERNIFAREDVRAVMEKYVLARLYTDRREESNVRNRKMQTDRFNTIDLPFYAIISPGDSIIATNVFNREPDEFIAFLRMGLPE